MSDEDQALDLSNEVNEDDGQESSPSEQPDDKELQELIEKGRTFKQLEEEYPDTNWKELRKAFTQKTQEIAALKKAQKPEPVAINDEDPEAKIVRTIVSHPVFKQGLDESLQEYKQRIDEDYAMKEKLQELESKYDGSDGKPEFDRVKVLEYGKDHNISDPEVIYKIINEDALDEWKIKNAMSRKPKSTYAEKSGGNGNKAPSPRKAKTLEEAAAMSQADLEAMQD